MKNVLIVALAEQRFAVELRWVREIFTLGNMTPVPTAPAVIPGVVNYKGAIVPVLSGRRLMASATATQGRGRAPQGGDALVLVDVDGTRAAIAVDRIDAVTTLAAQPGGALADADGRLVPLLDPPALITAARQLVEGSKDVDGGHGARP
jgi:chemotaxis signal transduction protein